MSAFEKYSPFIRDYIYSRNWDSLREVQIGAAEVLFGTENNLLLTSSTASGKTEAAFFPIISRLYDDPPQTFGALYIAPLKRHGCRRRITIQPEAAGIACGFRFCICRRAVV